MSSYNKVVSIEEAVSHIADGSRIMVGGFAGTGNPVDLIKAIVAKGTKDLTLICNDTGLSTEDVGGLVIAKAVKKAIVSHIGTNPETCRQLAEGEIDVEFVPQGTLVERIRAGGFGLGGFLTPTGVGTAVEEGKQRITTNEKDYLLELPLKADVAIIRAAKADKMGNLCYHGTNVSHTTMMATAAAITIVQADEIVEVGEITPDQAVTPSLFINYIVQRGGN